ncbi:MAG TPA: DNA polymerase IV [Thermoplasmata archaeon]|nr:DNA polymerase IV [Thermoplasmata archaeon]
MRWVLYIDMDAFYVSCELRQQPELVGKPVIVGPKPESPRARGVVLSASYEARAHGVRSAMPVLRAAELLPDAVWIRPDFEKYVGASRELRALLKEVFGEVRMRSIDEAKVEVELATAAEAEAQARTLQLRIGDTLHLPASVGVSPHEVIAKIASDRAKPRGVVVVPPEGTEAFLAPLPARAIPGVGPKAELALAELGVRTIGELRTTDAARLRRRFGGFADELRAIARGAPSPPAPERSGPRQRSVDRTLREDTDDPAVLEQMLGSLASELAQSVAEEKLAYRSVVLRLRWADFDQTQMGRRLPASVLGEAPLLAEARRLLHRLLERERTGRGRPVRRLSLAVQEVARVGTRQRTLGEPEPEVPDLDDPH